jgi:hypothetical protein
MLLNISLQQAQHREVHTVAPKRKQKEANWPVLLVMLHYVKIVSHLSMQKKMSVLCFLSSALY